MWQWAQVQEVLFEIDEGAKMSRCAPYNIASAPQEKAPTGCLYHQKVVFGVKPLSELTSTF